MPLTPDTKLGKPKRRGLAPSGGAAAPAAWYADAIVAYQPKGAASLAASYTNLGTSGAGNNAAPGVAPTFSGGWVFNGSDQYLTTGLAIGTAYTVLIQYIDFTTGLNKTLFGSYEAADQAALVQATGSGMKTFHEAANSFVDPDMAAGNYGFAGQQAYRDGVAEGAVMATGTDPTIAAFIGALNLLGSAGQYSAVTVTAFGVWSTTLTAPQVAAKATAMAAV
jgi:hypothetical protein